MEGCTNQHLWQPAALGEREIQVEEERTRRGEGMRHLFHPVWREEQFTLKHK
jgi:hypothetical protein